MLNIYISEDGELKVTTERGDLKDSGTFRYSYDTLRDEATLICHFNLNNSNINPNTFFNYDRGKLNMSFDIDLYAGKNIAMHCPTKESAKIFLSYLKSKNKKWINNAEYDENVTLWDIYKSKSYYIFNLGMVVDEHYVKEHDSLILEFHNYDWSKYRK